MEEPNREVEKIRFKADRINLKANIILAGIVAIITVIAAGLMTSDATDISWINGSGFLIGLLLFCFLFCWQCWGIRNIPILWPLLRWMTHSDREKDGYSIGEQVDRLEKEIDEVYSKKD